MSFFRVEVTFAALVFCSLLGVFLSSGARPGVGATENAQKTEQDQHEDKAIARAVERELRIAKSDRTQWLKELNKEFPNRVSAGVTDEDFVGWFFLLAGNGGEWRRENAPNKQFMELFDRVVQRLELGPVPSIRKDEFVLYAKKALRAEKHSTPPDPHAEADKVFRVLDRNADGVLDRTEWTIALREVVAKADSDMNGRIDRDEYRTYFQSRVTTAVDAGLAAKPETSPEKGKDPKVDPKAARGPGGLPPWFKELDADGDGQVALSEWRKAGLPIAVFKELDADDDGLLTAEEYLRFVRMNGEDSVVVDVRKRTASINSDKHP